jgi:NAD(P)-dependent dehydrogenase (short-subunit alcohol dehydrogenase family)
MNLFDLTGEIAAVVGGTGVLGGAIAEGLAMAGARVAILGRNQKRAETRIQSIEDHGGIAEFFVADALDQRALKSGRECDRAARRSNHPGQFRRRQRSTSHGYARNSLRKKLLLQIGAGISI